jgi:hypothetical protein
MSASNRPRQSVIETGKAAADLMAAYAGPVINEWPKAIEAASAKGDHRPAKDGDYWSLGYSWQRLQ